MVLEKPTAWVPLLLIIAIIIAALTLYPRSTSLQAGPSDDMNRIRIIVEGYGTCGYYQRAMALWGNVSKQHPSVEVLSHSQERSRNDYRTWLAERSNELGIQWRTSPLVVMEQGTETKVIGGYDDSVAYVQEHFPTNPKSSL